MIGNKSSNNLNLYKNKMIKDNANWANNLTFRLKFFLSSKMPNKIGINNKKNVAYKFCSIIFSLKINGNNIKKNIK